MMLRCTFAAVVQLSDPGAEEALYDSVSMRRFAGIDSARCRCRMNRRAAIRHLLEAHGLGKKLFSRCMPTWSAKASRWAPARLSIHDHQRSALD